MINSLPNIALFLLLHCPSGPGPAVPEATPDWPRLLGGEILVQKINDEKDLPGIRAMFTVAATREELWGMLTDYDNFRNIYGGFDSLRVLSEDSNGAEVEFYQSVLFWQIRYVLYRQYVQKGHRLTWERVSGDLKEVRGSWEILDSPEPGILLVTYTSYFRYGGIVPPRVSRNWAIHEVTGMVENARKWIREKRQESGILA